MGASRHPTVPASLLAVATVVSACSFINAPDEIDPGGAGGAGATTSQTTTAASTGSGDATTAQSSSASQGGGVTGTTTGGEGGGGQGGEGGVTPPCNGPEDCEATQCQDATCDEGRCVVVDLPVGTACGPTAAECVAGGVCDVTGACFVADTEGASCDSCDGDPGSCVCRGETCETCEDAAPINFFADETLAGWTLSGGWGLYTRFPRDRQSPTEVRIGKRVLGTDGNRSHPYPGGADPAVGGSIESSEAVSPFTSLPATLTFRSWHEDEAGANGRDLKAIELRTAGGDVTTLVDCAGGVEDDQPFCQPVNLAVQRAADAWDLVEITIPRELVGESMQIAFLYDSIDAIGGRERGWFIDALSAAGRCGCASDDDCAYLSGACAEAVCDEGSCTFTSREGSVGIACGAGTTSGCDNPDRCDDAGLCDAQHRVDGTACNDCDDGECQACGAGICLTCEALLQTFDGLVPTAGWTLEGGWQVRGAAPASDNATVVFASSVLGTDGGIGGEETSIATTVPTTIPEALTFRSWHVDQGGTQGSDNKTITILTAGGDPVVIVDCAGGIEDEQPFCAEVTGPRDAADFDEVTIPTGAAAGAVGTILFGYDTGDGTQSFEQGWYIDDLNAVRCP
jgi:hypothetical protein